MGQQQFEGITGWSVSNKVYTSFGYDAASMNNGEMTASFSFSTNPSATGNLTAMGYSVEFIQAATNNCKLHVHNGTTLYTTTLTLSTGGTGFSNTYGQLLLIWDGVSKLELWGTFPLAAPGRLSLLGSVTATVAPTGNFNPWFYWTVRATAPRTGFGQWWGVRDVFILVQ